MHVLQRRCSTLYSLVFSSDDENSWFSLKTNTNQFNLEYYLLASIRVNVLIPYILHITKNEHQIKHLSTINIVMTHLSLSNRISNMFLMNFDFVFSRHNRWWKKVARAINSLQISMLFVCLCLGNDFKNINKSIKHMISTS